MIKTLILYFQFFTSIPINYQVKEVETKLKEGILYLPLFAFLYASLLVGLFLILRQVFSLGTVWTALIAFDVLLTRGFHYDALADTADGLFSSRKPEKMIEIMKDSAIGVNGVLVLVLYFLLTNRSGEELLASHPFNDLLLVLTWAASGRCILPLMFYQMTYVGHNLKGLGSLFVGISRWKIIVSQCLSLAVFYSIGWQLGLAYFLSLFILLFYRYFVFQRIGGMTGDTLGASVLIGQLVYLFTLLLIFRMA